MSFNIAAARGAPTVREDVERAGVLEPYSSTYGAISAAAAVPEAFTTTNREKKNGEFERGLGLGAQEELRL